MMLFGALMSELPIWGEYTYKMDASMLPVGARAGLSVSPSGLKRGAFVGGAWGPANYLWDFDYSPDGKFLVMAAHHINIMLEGIALFNVENLDKLPALTAVYELVRSVTFSPDGRTIAAGKLDGTVALIDPDRRILIASNDHGYHPRYLGNGELDEELYKIIHLYETTYKFDPDEGSRCPMCGLVAGSKNHMA